MGIFDICAVLIGLAALYGYINHKLLHLPHTIGMVLIALATSLTIIMIELLVPSAHFDKPINDMLQRIDFHEALMNGMLSFLLFAGSLQVDFSAFRSRSKAIAIMATLGTLLSTFVIGTTMFLLLKGFGFNMPFIWTLVFGALISPTDPVAILGLFKSAKVPRGLQAMMTGESLFNDGIGVVVFTVVVAIAVNAGAQGSHMGPKEITELFLIEVLGGAVLGLIAGYVGYRAMLSIDEHNLEVLITLAVVMVTYSLAIHTHMSGPIAMVVAGLFIGDKGMQYAVSENTKDYIHKFWSLLDEILNSVLFLLIGLEMLIISPTANQLIVSILVIPLVLGARWICVYIPILILSKWETFTKGAVPILTWGGLRGGIAVALALSLPNNEFKPLILSATYAVVLFSIIVQGLSIKMLISRMLIREAQKK